MIRHRKITASITIGILASAFALAQAPAAHAADTTTTADLATATDYPLVKTKFGLFNSCLVPLTRLQRDIGLIDALRPDSYRFDGGLGGGTYPTGNSSPGCRFTEQPVTGTASNLQYNYSEFDQLTRLLRQHNVDPYWSYEYTPVPLQPAGGDYRSVPTPQAAFTQVAQNFAAHFRTDGQHVPYGEILNEPDLASLFWSGSQTDAFNTFSSGIAGLKAGDPDVKVGGPALFGTNWQDPFLSYVAQKRQTGPQPLDFFSFHYYGDDPISRATTMNNALDYAGYNFANTELHLNEYNYASPTGGSGTDNPVDHYQGAPNLLNGFKKLIEDPQVTEVNWAQFQDADCTGCGRLGLVTTEGHVTATYNAWKAYAMMPVDRKQLTISGSTDIDGLASSDSHHSSNLLWNQSSTAAHSVTSTLKDVPFQTGTVRVYRIDADHASYYDNAASETFTPSETYSNVNTANWTWNGSIPARGTVLIDVTDGSGISDLTPAPAAHYISSQRYYPDRKTTSYSDFDRNTWIARQGMGGQKFADQEIGAVADQLPSRLRFTTQEDGPLTAVDSNSCACVRIDYRTADGYTKGVLFHGPYKGGTDLYNSSRNAPAPFGTKTAPNQVVQVADLSSFSVAPADYAPAGWDGRATISYLLQNAGPTARWRVQTQAGPVADFAMNEGSGTAIADSSGLANNGAASQTTWTTSPQGNALAFNGIGSVVNAGPASAANTGASSVTLSSWFKTTSAGAQRILSKGNYGWTNGYFLGIGFNGAGKVSAGFGAGGVQPRALLYSTAGSYNDGNWHHAAAVIDKSAGTATIYVDGVAQGVQTVPGTCGMATGNTVSIGACTFLSGTTTDPFTLGAYSGGAEYFSGSIKNVRVYRDALSGAQINSLIR